MAPEKIAPLTWIQLTEELSDQRKTGPVNIQDCQTRARTTAWASGLFGFSAGFAAQVQFQRILPSFVKKYFIIPAAVAVGVAIKTNQHLAKQCSDELVLGNSYAMATDADKTMENVT